MTFAHFFSDMGARPAGTSIDRVNSDGHYEPGNCRWADTMMQNRNRRGVTRIEDVRAIRAMAAAGEPQSRIAKRFGIGQQAVSKIVRRQRWGDVE